jgi:hypothetical protein
VAGGRRDDPVGGSGGGGGGGGAGEYEIAEHVTSSSAVVTPRSMAAYSVGLGDAAGTPRAVARSDREPTPGWTAVNGEGEGAGGTPPRPVASSGGRSTPRSMAVAAGSAGCTARTMGTPPRPLASSSGSSTPRSMRVAVASSEVGDTAGMSPRPVSFAAAGSDRVATPRSAAVSAAGGGVGGPAGTMGTPPRPGLSIWSLASHGGAGREHEHRRPAERGEQAWLPWAAGYASSPNGTTVASTDELSLSVASHAASTRRGAGGLGQGQVAQSLRATRALHVPATLRR